MKAAYLFMRRAAASSLLVLLMGAVGCHGQSKEPAMQVGPFGFLMNANESFDKESAPIFRVGVGLSSQDFIRLNPYLKNTVWIPQKGDIMDELRVALQAKTQLQYDDGDMRLKLCSDYASADGNKLLKDGVAFVGIRLCEAPINDFRRAIKLAHEVIAQLKQSSPELRDFSDEYLHAPPEQLEKIGGEIWKDASTKHFDSMPAGRSNPDNGDYLIPKGGEEAYFAGFLSHPVYENDINGQPRLKGGNATLGVFLGKRAIFQIGISAFNHWGGDNLTKAQRDELKYQVSMHFRLRNDIKLSKP